MFVRDLMNSAVVSITPEESAALAARLLSRHDLGSRAPVTIAPGDDIHAAARQMAARQVRRLPVVEGGKVVGMVSLGDLARNHRCDTEAAEALSDISANPKRHRG